MRDGDSPSVVVVIHHDVHHISICCVPDYHRLDWAGVVLLFWPYLAGGCGLP